MALVAWIAAVVSLMMATGGAGLLMAGNDDVRAAFGQPDDTMVTIEPDDKVELSTFPDHPDEPWMPGPSESGFPATPFLCDVELCEFTFASEPQDILVRITIAGPGPVAVSLNGEHIGTWDSDRTHWAEAQVGAWLAGDNVLTIEDPDLAHVEVRFEGLWEPEPCQAYREPWCEPVPEPCRDLWKPRCGCDDTIIFDEDWNHDEARIDLSRNHHGKIRNSPCFEPPPVCDDRFKSHHQAARPYLTATLTAVEAGFTHSVLVGVDGSFPMVIEEVRYTPWGEVSNRMFDLAGPTTIMVWENSHASLGQTIEWFLIEGEVKQFDPIVYVHETEVEIRLGEVDPATGLPFMIIEDGLLMVEDLKGQDWNDWDYDDIVIRFEFAEDRGGAGDCRGPDPPREPEPPWHPAPPWHPGPILGPLPWPPGGPWCGPEPVCWEEPIDIGDNDLPPRDGNDDDNGSWDDDDSESGDAESRVVICHVPPGNQGNAMTLEVAASAVRAHLAHGDSLGPCDDDASDTGGDTGDDDQDDPDDSPGDAGDDEGDDGDDNRSRSDMVTFELELKWGRDPHHRGGFLATDGAVIVPDGSVELLKEVRWETGRNYRYGTDDLVFPQLEPGVLAWQSSVTCCWDGLVVSISAPADGAVIIELEGTEYSFAIAGLSLRELELEGGRMLWFGPAGTVYP